MRINPAMILGLILALTSITHASARHLSYGAQTLVICTGYGLVKITLDADGNPVEHTLPCPDCIAAIAALLPDAALALDHFVASGTSQPALRTLSHPTNAGLWQQSRAPPFPV